MIEPISEVYCVDNLEYMRTISDKYFSLAIVDPPYNLPDDAVHDRGKLKNRILNSGNMEWDVMPPAEYFRELFRVSKNQIIWGGNYFNLPPTRGIGIWDKQQPFKNFSSFELFWTSFSVTAKIYVEATTRTNEDKIHPTQKSVKLYKWLLKNYAKEGDKILDTHLGSQSSRIACYEGGFDFFGCEIDPKYFESGCKRFEDYRLQGKLDF